MTAFLTRLAAAATGAPPAVRPRPRSRFEPESSGGAGDIVELQQEHVRASMEDIRALPDPDPPRTQGAAPSEPAAPPGQVPLPEKSSIAESGAAADVPPQPRRQPALLPADPPPLRDVLRENAPPPPVAATPTQPAVPEPSPQPPTRIDVPSPVAEERESHRDGEQPVREGILIAPPVQLILPAPAGQPVAAPHEDREAAGTPAPDIHVTIGRVEVRGAAQPPAATPQIRAPQAATPGLGLADYLRERTNGSRR